MYNLILKGTVDKKLVEYVENVYKHLKLYEFEKCLFTLDFLPKCNGGAGGFCDGDTEEVAIDIARKDSAGKVPKDHLMINIAHEMIHALQIASGRLVNKGFVLHTNHVGESIMATKQIFDSKEYTGVRYDEQPWEIEAYSLEQPVYEACRG